MTMGADELAARDHFVEGEAQAMPLAQADPADARRQALKMNLRARHVEPVMQMRIIRNQFFDLRIGLVDVLGIARQRGPAERSDAAAEQRADVLRHEARKIEGVRDARIAAPPAGCCCRSRIPAVPCALKRSRYSTCFAMERLAARSCRRDRSRAARPIARRSIPAAGSR